MLQVKDLMTTDLFTLERTDTLASARSIMKLGRIRHIPIVDDQNRFIGIVTHRDILSATVSKLAGIDSGTQKEIDSGIPVMSIMRPDVKYVTPETELKEAAKLLLEHKYGCLPVLEGDKLVGILTEADFLSLTISLMEALESES
ncbi:MAG: CBS domain-containing protein [Desulfonatronovibrionaceae bacterium]